PAQETRPGRSCNGPTLLQTPPPAEARLPARSAAEAIDRSCGGRGGVHMNASGCPGQAELTEFALGKLPRPVLERIAEHVERCPACESALQALDVLADSLLLGLRKAPGQEPPGVETVPQHLLTAALATPGHCPIGASPAAGGRRLGKFELLE